MDFKHFLTEYISQSNKIENLKLTDTLIVFHGTSFNALEKYNMLNGIDSTQIKSRYYTGLKHKGIFVSTDISTAVKFSTYNQIILQLNVSVNDLHSPQYGDTNEDESHDNIWKSTYPNSFRPSLSYSLINETEPQALHIGRIKPIEIIKIAINYDKDKKWYSREQAIKLLSNKNIKDTGIDSTDTNLTPEFIFEYIAKTHNMTIEKVKNAIKKMINDKEKLTQLFNDFLQPNAIDSLIKKLKVFF